MKRVVSVVSIVTALFNMQAFAVVINNDRVVDYEWNLSPDYIIVVGETSQGTLTVQSSAGKVITQIMSIGTKGADGTVNVKDGATIQINSGNYSYPLSIGGTGQTGNGSAGSTGTLNISGAGSQLIHASDDTGEIAVGSSGATGYLNISEGGKFSTNTRIYVGARGGTNSQGFVSIDGAGSELYSSQRILIGVWDTGSVTVSNGGSLITGNLLTIGSQADVKTKDSILIVKGTNSLAQVTGNTTIGDSGKGTVVVSDKGMLSTNKIIIANALGSIGELAIGSRKGTQATGAGTINTPEVSFGRGTGLVVFNHTDNNYNFSAKITGIGTVEAFSGKTILTGASTYTGYTNVSNATLQAGAANVFSANSDYYLKSGGIMRLDGYNQTIKTLDNAGVIDLTGANAGTTLTVLGNYVGNGGSLILGTALADDGATTDQLVINGNATGTTNVTVKNLGGLGDQTIEGIKIIDVAGTSSADAFTQKGRIVAGAYDYSLIKGSATGQDIESWYLTSLLRKGGGESTLRPEAGSYLANLTAANTLFSLRLHDRQSETQYIDPVTNERKTTSLWIRHSYGHNQFNNSTGQLATKSNRNIGQIGADIIQTSTSGKDGIHVGVMAGYGNSDSRTRSKVSEHSSSSNIKGYSAGVYGTWYADEASKTGLYVDSWLQWNQFKAKVNGQGLAQEKYKLKGITSSLETGYNVKLGDPRKDYELWAQPQIQATWMGVKADSHREDNGSNIGANRNNLQTRVGTRLYLAKKPQDNHPKPTINPFVEANWLHNTKTYHVSMDDAKVKQDGTRNIAEIKLGVEGNITANTNLWLNLGHQFGHNGYKDTSTVVGVKYKF